MSTIADLPASSVARRARLAAVSGDSHRTDTAVVIQKGEPAAAQRLRAALSARGLYCANVRLDVGGVLPEPSAAAFAVLVGADAGNEPLEPELTGWLTRARSAGVTIFSSVDDALAAAA